MRFTKPAFAVSAIFALVVPLRLAAQVVDGSGTTNVVPKWIDSNTLGNSNISVPGGVVTVTGKNGTAATNGGTAPAALRVTGGSAAGGTGFGHLGAGGDIQLLSGHGGSFSPQVAFGGTGASIYVGGGAGATCTVGGNRCIAKGGNGGWISLQPGGGGHGLTSTGGFGSLLLAPAGGRVGIGVSAPSQTLEVTVGGTTLADDWTIRSSRRFKTNIQPLHDALGTIEALQGVSYERKSDGKHEIGIVAEDVERVLPEVVAHDPDTHEVEGVDYSRLVALLIEAVKSQQAEIERLKSQMAQLTSNAAKQ
ncbi:MAG TPA: tail fiber domain-containing protein [Nitrospira sp.]